MIRVIQKPSNNFINEVIYPKYIIIHCIGYSIETAINILTKSVEDGGGGVSSHYLIPEVTRNGRLHSDSPILNPEYPIYSLVKPDKFARHAGKSKWQEDVDLNSQSIGIEFSSPNYANALQGDELNWYIILSAILSIKSMLVLN